MRFTLLLLLLCMCLVTWAAATPVTATANAETMLYNARESLAPLDVAVLGTVLENTVAKHSEFLYDELITVQVDAVIKGKPGKTLLVTIPHDDTPHPAMPKASGGAPRLPGAPKPAPAPIKLVKGDQRVFLLLKVTGGYALCTYLHDQPVQPAVTAEYYTKVQAEYPVTVTLEMPPQPAAFVAGLVPVNLTVTNHLAKPMLIGTANLYLDGWRSRTDDKLRAMLGMPDITALAIAAKGDLTIPAGGTRNFSLQVDWPGLKTGHPDAAAVFAAVSVLPEGDRMYIRTYSDPITIPVIALNRTPQVK